MSIVPATLPRSSSAVRECRLVVPPGRPSDPQFTSCVTDFTAQRRTFECFRASDGTGKKHEIPVTPRAFGRSRLILDAEDNAHAVMLFGRIVSAHRGRGWTDWAVSFDGADLRAFGEVLVDDSTVRDDGRFSVLCQERSSGDLPSPLRVVDFRLN